MISIVFGFDDPDGGVCVSMYVCDAYFVNILLKKGSLDRSHVWYVSYIPHCTKEAY